MNKDNKKKIRIKRNLRERQEGIALVEVIGALGIAVVVITALVSLSISTLRTSLNSKLLQESSDIANREVELVRAYRDSASWSDFINGVDGCVGGNECHMKSDLTVAAGRCAQDSVSDSNCSSTSIEAVTRYFTASDASTGGNVSSTTTVVRITVSVLWTVGTENKSTYIYTDLTNWRAK